jgi:hypothetical protein
MRSLTRSDISTFRASPESFRASEDEVIDLDEMLPEVIVEKFEKFVQNAPAWGYVTYRNPGRPG